MNKPIELREAFYENQYFDPQTVNKPYKKSSTIHNLSKLKKKSSTEISSQEHSGIYIKKSHEDLDDAMNNDELSINANSTDYIWNNSLDDQPSPVPGNKTEGRSSSQQAASTSPPPAQIKPKSHLFFFEEDDAEYPEKEYAGIEFGGKKIILVILFEASLIITMLLLLYFIYDVASTHFFEFSGYFKCIWIKNRLFLLSLFLICDLLVRFHKSTRLLDNDSC